MSHSDRLRIASAHAAEAARLLLLAAYVRDQGRGAEAAEFEAEALTMLARSVETLAS